MRNKIFAALICLVAALATSCEDDVSQIGSSLAGEEVAILVDSVFNVSGQSVYSPDYDPRSTVSLVGRLTVPEYGELNCSFMTGFIAAGTLNIPDSIGVERVDSMRLIMQVPRGSLTGDSLAPQQVKVYRLPEPLKPSADGHYDTSGYNDPSRLLGTRSFTLSALSLGDSVYNKSNYIDIPIDLGKDFARQIFNDYRNNPSIFQWPSTFAKYFPGIYAEPSFGRGCIANVSKTKINLYYYILKNVLLSTDSLGNKTYEQRHFRDSVTVFSSAPEVLSVNNIRYTLSDNLKSRVAAGEQIIASPGGYNLRLIFPLQEIIDKYNSKGGNMTVIDNLTFSFPAGKIDNDYGIECPPYLLMIKTKELDSFFAENKAPDQISSFTATYDSEKGTYTFGSMRKYIEKALKDPSALDESDYEFTIIPVTLVTENKYIGYNQTESVVIGCTPYILRPAMTRVHLDRAKIRLTYSRQAID